jgi:hypothetical protein
MEHLRRSHILATHLFTLPHPYCRLRLQGLRHEFAQYLGTPRPPEKQDLRSSSRFLASGRSRFCSLPEPATFAIAADERTANACNGNRT